MQALRLTWGASLVIPFGYRRHKPNLNLHNDVGASDRSRTYTGLPPLVPKTRASTSSATLASIVTLQSTTGQSGISYGIRFVDLHRRKWLPYFSAAAVTLRFSLTPKNIMGVARVQGFQSQTHQLTLYNLCNFTSFEVIHQFLERIYRWLCPIRL